MNILTFKLDANNTDAYEMEKLNVQNILKEGKYNVLADVGSGKQEVAVSQLGTEDQMNKIIVYAKSNENGFAVVKISVNKMTPTEIIYFVGILQKVKTDLDQLKPL